MTWSRESLSVQHGEGPRRAKVSAWCGVVCVEWWPAGARVVAPQILAVVGFGEPEAVAPQNLQQKGVGEPYVWW